MSDFVRHLPRFVNMLLYHLLGLGIYFDRFIGDIVWHNLPRFVNRSFHPLGLMGVLTGGYMLLLFINQLRRSCEQAIIHSRVNYQTQAEQRHYQHLQNLQIRRAVSSTQLNSGLLISF